MERADCGAAPLEGRLALADQQGAQGGRGKHELAPSAANGSNGRGFPNRPFLSSWRRPAETRVEPEGDASIISVPNLAAGPEEREAPANSLSQRYAAIWTLADQGASPEVIAKATGQPIGQIELILGLRRHIDGSRTTIPHAPHA